MDVSTGGCLYGWEGVCIDGRMFIWMGGCLYRWKGVCIGGSLCWRVVSVGTR